MRHITLTSYPDPDLAARWHAALETAPFATHYVTPEYFTDPYVQGRRFAVLAEEADGEITAVLTGTVDGGRVISGMFSRPQMVFTGKTDRERTVDTLVAGIEELTGGTTSFIELHAWQEIPEFQNLGMQVRPSNDETSVVVLDLSDDAEAIFARFSQTRRNEIRRAIKQGAVEVKELETELELAELYKIHCEWNARKGNDAGTLEDMQRAAAQRNNRRVFIAKTEGRVIAGSFYRFTRGGVVEYAANFSMPEHQKLRPNDLIGWHAIRWACDNGFSHFSMGGSHLFLRRFGGETLTTYRYRLDQSVFRLHDLRESAREFGVAAFRRLPENVRSGVRKVLAR